MTDHQIFQRLPATTRVVFATAERGGTGRFELVVQMPDGLPPLIVRPSLSKWQAEEGAKAINTALGEWIRTGAILLRDP